MAVERRRQPLKIDIPQDDSPRLARVGLIAIAGFAIGAVWPTLAKVKLVPSAPVQAAPQPGLGGEPVPPAPPAAPTSAAPKAEPSPVETAEAKGTAPGLELGEQTVTSCRDARGQRAEACDKIDFDRVARRRLTGLDACRARQGASGVLSLGFELDFSKHRVTRVFSGKSTSLEEGDTESLVECASKAFRDLTLEGLEHEHSSYTVFYRVELRPSADAAPSAESGSTPDGVPVTPASGRATVSWEVALVRSAPSRDGQVMARILSGTRVVVTGRSGDWYQIKFDAKGSQGWVFRTAIGM